MSTSRAVCASSKSRKKRAGVDGFHTQTMVFLFREYSSATRAVTVNSVINKSCKAYIILNEEVDVYHQFPKSFSKTCLVFRKLRPMYYQDAFFTFSCGSSWVTHPQVRKFHSWKVAALLVAWTSSSVGDTTHTVITRGKWDKEYTETKWEWTRTLGEGKNKPSFMPAVC